MFNQEQLIAESNSKWADNLAPTLKAVVELGLKNEAFHATLDQAKEKEVFLVIGTTGAGKSTSINYNLGQHAIFQQTGQSKSEIMYCDIAIIYPVPQRDKNKDTMEYEKQIFEWKEEYRDKKHQLEGFLFIFSHDKSQWMMLHLLDVHHDSTLVKVEENSFLQQLYKISNNQIIKKFAQVRQARETLNNTINTVLYPLYKFIDEKLEIEKKIFSNSVLAKTSSKGISCTTEIKIYQTQEGNFLADCPGFGDTGENNKIHNSISIQRFINAVKIVRGIIVVIDWPSLNVARFEGFPALANTLNKFISRLESIPVLFLINKCGISENIEGVYDFVNERSKEAEKNLMDAYIAIQDHRSPEHHPETFEKYKKLLNVLKSKMHKDDDGNIESNGIILVNFENDETKEKINEWLSRCCVSQVFVDKTVFDFKNDPDRLVLGQAIDKKVPHWIDQIKKCIEAKKQIESYKESLEKQNQIVSSQQAVENLKKSYLDSENGGQVNDNNNECDAYVGGCDLYLMKDLPADRTKFKNSYIWGDTYRVLYYIKSSGDYEVANIVDFKILLEGLTGANTHLTDEIIPCVKNELKIHLSAQKLKELITLNGGHAPGYEVTLINDFNKQIAKYNEEIQKLRNENKTLNELIAKLERSTQLIELKKIPIDVENQDSWWNGYFGNIYKTVNYINNDPYPFVIHFVDLEAENLSTDKRDNRSFVGWYKIPYQQSARGSILFAVYEKDYLGTKKAIQQHIKSIQSNQNAIVELQTTVYTLTTSRDEIIDQSETIKKLNSLENQLRANQISQEEHKKTVEGLLEQLDGFNLLQLLTEKSKLEKLINEKEKDFEIFKKVILDVIEKPVIAIKHIVKMLDGIDKISGSSLPGMLIQEYDLFHEMTTPQNKADEFLEEHAIVLSEIPTEIAEDFNEEMFVSNIINLILSAKQYPQILSECEKKYQRINKQTFDFYKFQGYLALIKGLGAKDIENIIPQLCVSLKMFSEGIKKYPTINSAYYMALFAKIIHQLIEYKIRIDFSDLKKLIDTFFAEFSNSKQLYAYPLVLISAKTKNIKLIEFFIECGAKINALDSHECHLLDYLLCDLLHSTDKLMPSELSDFIANSLIPMGIKLEMGRSCISPAMHALVKYVDVVKTLWEGISVKDTCLLFLLLRREHPGKKQKFLLASYAGETVFKRIMEKSKNVPNKEEINDYRKAILSCFIDKGTFLHPLVLAEAISFKDSSLIEFFLNEYDCRKALQSSLYYGASALALAVSSQQKETISLLLKKGAPVNKSITSTLSKVVQKFLGDNQAANCLDFHSSYDASFFDCFLPSFKNSSHCVYYLFSDVEDSKYIEKFQLQLSKLILLSDKTNRPGLFISKESNDPIQYILGMYFEKKLIIVNPLGISKIQTFYDALNGMLQLNPELIIWLSETRFQQSEYEDNSLYSSGALILELSRYILEELDENSLAEFFSYLTKEMNSFNQNTYLELEENTQAVREINYYKTKINPILPKSLQGLLLANSKEKYQAAIVEIRKIHFNLLCYYTTYLPCLNNISTRNKMTINSYIECYNTKLINSPMNEVMNLLVVENKTIENIDKTPQYLPLQLALNDSFSPAILSLSSVSFSSYLCQLSDFYAKHPPFQSGLSLLRFALLAKVDYSIFELLIKSCKSDEIIYFYQLRLLYDASNYKIFKLLWNKLKHHITFDMLKQKYIYDSMLLHYIILHGSLETIKFLCNELLDLRYRAGLEISTSIFWHLGNLADESGSDNAITLSKTRNLNISLIVQTSALSEFFSAVNYFLENNKKEFKGAAEKIIKDLSNYLKTILANTDQIANEIKNLILMSNNILPIDQIITYLIKNIHLKQNYTQAQLPSLFLESISAFFETNQNDKQLSSDHSYADNRLEQENENLKNKLIDLCFLVKNNPDVAKAGTSLFLEYHGSLTFSCDALSADNFSPLKRENANLKTMLVQLSQLIQNNFEAATQVSNLALEKLVFSMETDSLQSNEQESSSLSRYYH